MGRDQRGARGPRAGDGVRTLVSQAAPPTFQTTSPTLTPQPKALQPGSMDFTSAEGGHDMLWVHGIGQTKEPMALPNVGEHSRDPVWSPDGSRIAFMSHKDGNWELYTLNAASGEVSRLTFGLSYEGAPTWSPDGKWLAYEGYD